MLVGLGATPALAEGNCPPGMYEMNGIGFQSCAPIPGYDQGGGYADYGGGGGGGGGEYSMFDSPAALIAGIAAAIFSGPGPGQDPGQTDSPQAAQQLPDLPPLPDGAEEIHVSREGIWLLFRQQGACSAVFGHEGQLLVFAGPAGKRPGAITFMGPNIPPIDQVAEVSVTLLADGKPAKVKALHVSSGPSGAIIVPTVITDTLHSLGDSEAVAVKLGSKTVFSTKTVATFAARDALLSCLR